LDERQQGGIQGWWKKVDAKKYDEISMPLWTFKGTSRLSSYEIPRLLFGERVDGGPITNIHNPASAGL
jgi:hypothetical protein